MPLVGIVDPSHDELSSNEPGRYPRWFTREEVLTRALNADPKWSPWPYELLTGILSEFQDRDYISVTMITDGCPRSSVIERKEDYILPISKLYASYRGTLFHAMLENHARPNSIAEHRFHTTVDGLALSCSPDLVTPDGLWDWKMTENPPTFGYPWKKHTQQVQWNRYIVNNCERWEHQGEQNPDLPFNPRTANIRNLVVVYLGPKGPKPILVEKSMPYTTPNGKSIKRKQPHVLTDEEVLEAIRPRLRNMSMALEAYPRWPKGLEDEPGWAGPASWDCPGPPLCYLPDCAAKRWPNGLMWDQPRE